jgi:MFS family permease
VIKFIKLYSLHIKYFSKNANLFLLGGLFNGLGLAVFGLLFNLYLKEKGFTESQIGSVLSWGSLGSAVIAIPAAMILERIHIRKILIWSTVLAAVSYFVAIFSQLISLIFLFMFLANMFITVYRVSIAPFIMRNSTKRERIFLFSFNGAITMLSSLLGFMLGGFLPQLLLNLNIAESLAKAYELSLYVSVVGTLVSIIPFLNIKQTHTPIKNTNFLKGLKNYSWRILIRLIIPKLLVGLGAGLVIPFMNLYFETIFKADSASIGTFFSLLQVFLFIGFLITPQLSNRFGMLNTIVLTQLISIPFMFILALSHNLPLAVVAFIARGTLMNLNQPVVANFEMELVKPSEQPFTNAISTLTWQASWTISAWLGGHIIEKYSFAWSFYITIVFYLLSAGSYYLFFKKSVDKKTV